MKIFTLFLYCTFTYTLFKGGVNKISQIKSGLFNVLCWF